jgi:hypothetical protein
LFLKAIEAALPEIPLPEDCKDSLHVSAETSGGNHGDASAGITPTMRRADALIVIAESFLQHGAAAMKGGDRHQVVVHIDDATLCKGEVGRCELDDGPAIPVETARRDACAEHCADGGETKLSNLATLCRFHHCAVQEGGLKMKRRYDGAWRFFTARGESLYGCAPVHTQPLADWRRLPASAITD